MFKEFGSISPIPEQSSFVSPEMADHGMRAVENAFNNVTDAAGTKIGFMSKELTFLGDHFSNILSNVAPPAAAILIGWYGLNKMMEFDKKNKK
jgi:hypothetical protein